MGRTAKAILYGSSYKIETDINQDAVLGRIKAKSYGGDIWDYLYPIYVLDERGRLVYLEQFNSGLKGIRHDINTIASNPHPSAEEVFESVEIIDEDSGKVLKVLKDVNLTGILEGIAEVMRDR